MQAVFFQSLKWAATQGVLTLASVSLRELLYAPLALLRVHRFERQKRATSGSALGDSPPAGSTLTPPLPDGRESWRQAGLEISLFLSMGALLILVNYQPSIRPGASWQRGPGIIGVAIALLPAPAFLAGLVTGLPRWAYPCGGILLGYSFSVAHRFDLVPLLAFFLLASIALAVTAAIVHSRYQPLPPLLRRMGQSIGLDLTRLSFCVYGIMPLLIVIAFDDSRYNNRAPDLATSVLLMIAGAFVYARSRRSLLQMTALLGGMSLAFCCALLDQATLTGGLESWLSFLGSRFAEISWML